MVSIQNIPKQDILYRYWGSKDPKAILLLVHGLGAHSERWEAMAKYLLKKKINSYAIELKGFGENKSPDGDIASFKIYYQDITQLAKFIQQQHPGKKIFLAGESLGGLLVLLATRNFNYQGVISLVPAIKSCLKFSVGQYLLIGFYLFFWRRGHIKMPFTGKMLTHDRKTIEKLSQDKRELRRISVRLLWQTLLAQRQLPKLAGKISLPVLFLISGQDQLVDSAASQKYFHSLACKDKKMKVYKTFYHALSIEKSKDKIFADIWDWLKQRI